MYDVEREGGSRTSDGDVGVGAYVDAEAEAEAETGVGSLEILVIGGATGESDGAEAGCGVAAVVERLGTSTGAATADAADTVPVSSETYLSEMAFPEKNSPAESEGSMEGAGGNMSDWNESDCRVIFFFFVSE